MDCPSGQTRLLLIFFDCSVCLILNLGYCVIDAFRTLAVKLALFDDCLRNGCVAVANDFFRKCLAAAVKPCGLEVFHSETVKLKWLCQGVLNVLIDLFVC